MIASDELAQRFAYHPPRDADTVTAHERVREWTGQLAAGLNAVLPDGREKSLAITSLEETMMWANAAISRNGGPARVPLP